MDIRAKRKVLDKRLRKNKAELKEIQGMFRALETLCDHPDATYRTYRDWDQTIDGQFICNDCGLTSNHAPAGWKEKS